MKCLIVIGRLGVIDLGDDYRATLRMRRRLHCFGIVLLVGTVVALVLRAIEVAGDQGIASWIVSASPLFLFLYATLCFYLSDVPRGNLAAFRGMIVGGGSVSVWMGWDCAWTTPIFHPGLGLLGMVAGFLAGAMFGAIVGVFLGWLKQSVLPLVVKPSDAIPEKGLVRDRWLDEA